MTDFLGGAFMQGAFGGSVTQSPVPVRRASVFNWWIDIAQPSARPIPDVRRRLSDIRRMTHWSDRQIAKAVGVSHPTIAAMFQGRLGRVSNRSRVADVHDLVRRIYSLCGENPEATDRVLAAPAPSPTPIVLVGEGQSTRAYLAAIERINPRQEGLMRGSRPADVGRSTSLVTEDGN